MKVGALFVSPYVSLNKVYNSLIIHFKGNSLNAVLLLTRFACIFLPKALNISKCVCYINSFDTHLVISFSVIFCKCFSPCN